MKMPDITGGSYAENMQAYDKIRSASHDLMQCVEDAYNYAAFELGLVRQTDPDNELRIWAIQKVMEQYKSALIKAGYQF